MATATLNAQREARDRAHRIRRTAEEVRALRTEALTRATTGQTWSNYPAIFQGFMALGIPEAEIHPRENVFTFEAWRALGRHVRRGQHGVRVVTYIEATRTETDPETGEETEQVYRRPWHTTVFHISQTDPDQLPTDKEDA